MSKLKTYECRIEGYFKDSSDLISNHIAQSHSAARYAYWQAHQECLSPYSACLRVIKVRSLGAIHASQFFGNKEDFMKMCEQREIPFAYQGMSVDVAGKIGVIVGSNSSMNLDVLFEGYSDVSNCHPTWETTYYDDKMNVVKDFKQSKRGQKRNEN